MAGIQTAIAQAMGAIGGAALVGKGVAEDAAEKQAEQEEKRKAIQKAAEKSAVAQALKMAASYQKISDPIYFWKNEEPLATSEELASVVAEQSVYNKLDSKKRTKAGIKARLSFLNQKSNKPQTTGYELPKVREDYTYGR